MVVVIVIAIIIALVLIVAANRPDAFRIERRINIKATPEQLFPLINDFHRWKSWSPWEKMDPAMNRTYSGKPSGVGAIYEWVGNKKVGQGRMEIAEASENTRLFILLEFIKPFAAKNTAEFTFQQQGDETLIVWAMEGKQPLMAKVMCLFMDMDKMVGKDFEEGLQNLQRVATA
jgi:uncharacterized protein YndB with AHSA1/START domain